MSDDANPITRPGFPHLIMSKVRRKGCPLVRHSKHPAEEGRHEPVRLVLTTDKTTVEVARTSTSTTRRLATGSAQSSPERSVMWCRSARANGLRQVLDDQSRAVDFLQLAYHEVSPLVVKVKD